MINIYSKCANFAEQEKSYNNRGERVEFAALLPVRS